MKVSILTLSVMLALMSLSPAQTATDLNEGATITPNWTPDAFTFSWWGKAGRTYFIQQSDDLINWNHVPVIESGWDDVIQWGFSSTAPRSFFRLSYSDASVVDPLVADFDNDDISNQDEVFIYHTDPLQGDTDGDGIGDGSEVQQGTNPLNAASKPAFQSLMLTGNGAEGERKTKQMTITLPAGDKSYLVVIAAKSEEFPQWTGEASEYDDVVDWKISPAGGTVIEGEKHVNPLHSEWEESVANGTSLLGLSPVAILQVETIKGSESGTTSVQIEIGAKNVSDGILPTTVAVAIYPIAFDIWNGQDAVNAVVNKTDVGAFTVANLNDTDGDGSIDKDDTDVSGEKDLMKLYVGGYAGLPGKLKLTVKSGGVKFWEDKEKKSQPITLDANGAVFFDIPASGMDKTIWVEAPTVSGSLRDIEIWAGYKDAQGKLSDGIDKVKATAVWVEPGPSGIINAGNTLPGNLDDSTAVNTFQGAHDSKFGIFDASPGKQQFSYSIGFEFKVKPAGIGNEPGIKFDVSRQRETVTWVKDDQGWFGNPAAPFPTTPDEPNDDNNTIDEDNSPTNDLIYSMDNPFAPFFGVPAERVVKRGNFREFVRVRIDGQAFQNQNGVVEGSRSSNFQNWRVRSDISVPSGTWILTPGGSNELQGGHVPLGNHP